MMEALLTVSFVITPVLGAPGAAPKLEVTLHNESAKSLEFMRFEADACFAQFFLSLGVTLPNGTKAQPAGCPIRSWPGVKGTLAAGAKEKRVLDLARVFPGVKWAAGKYGLVVEWDPKALEAYFDGAYATRASQYSLNESFFVLAKSLGSVRVTKGQSLKLPGGGTFTFDSHGHKRTMEGGPPSPLLIRGALNGKPFDVALDAGDAGRFTIDGLTFVLRAHEYDGWMELDCFGGVMGR